MQIAKLFASLGFKIDTADLSRFEAILSKAQGEMSQFAQATQRASTKLRIMESRFKKTSDSLNSSNVAKAADRVAKAVDKYVKNAKEIVDIDGKVDRVFKDTGVRVDLLSNKLDGGTSAWNRYEQQVKEATTRMREFTAAARERQSVNPPRSTGAGSGSNQGGGGGRGSGGRGNNGYDDEDGGLSGMLLGGQKFGKAFVGQMALGGALGAGYAIKEIVQTGREVQKMEQMLLQASTTTEDFEQNLSFVHKMAQELKIAFDGAGFAYAKILSSTSDSNLTKKNKEDLIYGLSKYMRTVNLADYDQAGVYKQIGQMFNNQRIQQDELNSIAERGIPIAKFMRQAVKELGMTQAQYVKEQEAGKADPIKYMPIVARLMKEAADNNGAYEKSLNTSLAAQSDFMNSMKKMSSDLLKNGLDKALKGMFDALTFVVEILTPMVVGLMAAIGGVVDVIKILFGFDWKVYAGIVAAALLLITAGFYSIGGAALVAEVAVYGLGVAMGALQRLIPLAALAGMIYFLGEYTKWQKEQESGVETFTWIDLWAIRLQFFFALMKIGWLNTRIAISDSINAIDKFFSITPPKWFSDFMERKQANPEKFNQESIDRLKDQQSGLGLFGMNNEKQNLTVPVEVFLTIQNPDGTNRMEKVTGMSTINIGNQVFV